MASQASVDYNRAKELEEFDATKAGVRGLVDAGIVNLPKMFIRPAEELAEELIINSSLRDNNNNIKVPIIDLANIEDNTLRKEIVDQVKIASKEWGVFHLINHGVPLNVMDEMIDGIRMFNEQDLESKKEIYSRDITKKVRFNSNFDLFRTKTADWKDTLYLFSGFDPNEIPALCRNSTIEYVSHIRRLSETIFGLLSEALGLQPDHLSSLGCGKGYSVITHYYPVCPQPELTMGVKKHNDPGVLNIFMQNEVGGLQVLHEDQWIDVDPIRGGLVVNMGDLLQIMSNDKLKSVLHKATVNNVKTRITVSCSFEGDVSLLDKTVGPIKELTSEADPPRYKEIVSREYLERFRSRSLGGKPLIDYYKL